MWDRFKYDPITYNKSFIGDGFVFLPDPYNPDQQIQTTRIGLTAKISGTYTFSLQAVDDEGAESNTITETFTVINNKPVVTDIKRDSDTPEIHVGELGKWILSGTDIDDDDLKFSIVESSLPAEMTGETPISITDNGVISWTPPIGTSDKTFEVEFRAHDGEVFSNAKKFPLKVDNRAPVFDEEKMSNELSATTAHGNHDFSMEVLVSDPDEDPFVVSLSPEDEAKLQTYGLELVEDADKNYKVQSAVGGVKYYNEDPLSISFSLNADDNKSLGSVIYTHSLTLHPNYDPEIDVVDAKPGVGSAADTIIFFWNDDPSAPVHNEAIINLTDANGDEIIFEQNIEMPKDGMSIIKNELTDNSYKLTYVGDENAESGQYSIKLIAYDRFGGAAEKEFIIKLVSKYYKNKVLPYQGDAVDDEDVVQVLKNNQLLTWYQDETEVILKEQLKNSNINNNWDDFSTFSYLTTYGDKTYIKGLRNVGTTSGQYIRVAWKITESEGHSEIDNFPNPYTKDYFFVGILWKFISKYRDIYKIPTDWEDVCPLTVGQLIRIKTAGDPDDY